MPIFVKKFGKKSLPKPRESRLNSVPKLSEELDSFKNISIKFDDEKVVKFVNGVWISSKKSGLGENDDETMKLVTLNKKLEEEKMMLSAKLEICLDLLSETIAEKDSMMNNK
jgi:Chibby family